MSVPSLTSQLAIITALVYNQRAGLPLLAGMHVLAWARRSAQAYRQSTRLRPTGLSIQIIRLERGLAADRPIRGHISQFNDCDRVSYPFRCRLSEPASCASGSWPQP